MSAVKKKSLRLVANLILILGFQVLKHELWSAINSFVCYRELKLVCFETLTIISIYSIRGLYYDKDGHNIAIKTIFIGEQT